MDNAVTLKSEQQKTVQIRMAKIIGQLKTVAKMVGDEEDGLQILMQYSAANAAVSSLMKLIAKCALEISLGKEPDELATEQYINHMMFIMADFDDEEDEDDYFDNGVILV